jgi:protein-tyrosine phosphatase
MTSPLPARFNLRDLGGLPAVGGEVVRPGLLFRGAGLHRLEPEHLPHLDRLGIRLAIDLRTSREKRDGVLAADGVEVVGLPLFEVAPAFDPKLTDPVGVLAGTYLWMLEEGRDSIARIFELLAEPSGYPVVIYCAAGKDRTGVVCALILRLIGVDSDTVVADYVLSDAPARSLRAWHQEQEPARRDPNPVALYAAPGEAMRRFLDEVDVIYGSVDGYLAEVGVPVAAARTSIRGRLIERDR